MSDLFRDNATSHLQRLLESGAANENGAIDLYPVSAEDYYREIARRQAWALQVRISRFNLFRPWEYPTSRKSYRIPDVDKASTSACTSNNTIQLNRSQVVKTYPQQTPAQGKRQAKKDIKNRFENLQLNNFLPLPHSIETIDISKPQVETIDLEETPADTLNLLNTVDSILRPDLKKQTSKLRSVRKSKSPRKLITDSEVFQGLSQGHFSHKIPIWEVSKKSKTSRKYVKNVILTRRY